MAPVSDVEREGDGSSRSLSREDCLCPICLEIFMEPVTLPCTHTFCKVCFLESVDKATLCCPLCRKRVSVWARQHGRTKTLVNEALWRRVQAAFPRQKLQEEPYEPVCFPRLSEPGAVRREYEDQLSKLTAEKAALEEQQSKASEELIQKLLAEEEQLQMEQQQRHQEDEAMARLLSQELNSDVSRTPEPSAEKKRPTGIDRFLFPLSRSPAQSSASNKENVLVAPDPPPLDYYGPHTGQSQPREPHTGQSQPREPHTGQSQPREPHTGQSQPREPDTGQSQPREPHTGQSQLRESHTGQSQPEEPRAEGMDQSQFEGGVKRKSSSEEEEESQGKRSCQSSSVLGVAMGEWEAELQRRREQEEEDLRVALKLQRQLDRQHQRTDRSKGSDDAYELRAPPRGQATPTRRRASASSTATLNRASASSTATLNRASASSTVTLNRASSESLSPKASASSALATPTTQKRGAVRPKTSQTPPHTPKSRQTTLTDLFNLQ